MESLCTWSHVTFENRAEDLSWQLYLLPISKEAQSTRSSKVLQTHLIHYCWDLGSDALWEGGFVKEWKGDTVHQYFCLGLSTCQAKHHSHFSSVHLPRPHLQRIVGSTKVRKFWKSSTYLNRYRKIPVRFQETFGFPDAYTENWNDELFWGSLDSKARKVRQSFPKGSETITTNIVMI